MVNTGSHLCLNSMLARLTNHEMCNPLMQQHIKSYNCTHIKYQIAQKHDHKGKYENWFEISAPKLFWKHS